MNKPRFVLMEHQAQRAGLHRDLRFKIGQDKWASFAIRKNPIEIGMGQRMLAIRTDDHDESCAKFEGLIVDGYGKGTLKKIDEGMCLVRIKTDKKFLISISGTFMRGSYCLVKAENIQPRAYILFKKCTQVQKGQGEENE